MDGVERDSISGKLHNRGANANALSGAATGAARGAEAAAVSLRSCEAKLIASIREDWALQFGSREVRLIIEYQDGLPVLIRVTDNKVKEEKLR